MKQIQNFTDCLNISIQMTTFVFFRLLEIFDLDLLNISYNVH